ncbi:MAG: TRAP transporter small permease [Granulosicoccaceae bacterium]
MSDLAGDFEAPPPQPTDFFGRLCSWLSDIGAVVLFALMILTCVDVLGRYLFNSPLNGGTELTEFALAIIVFSAIPIITLTGGNVVVELIDFKFSAKSAVVAKRVLDFIWAAVFSGIAYGVWKLGARAIKRSEVSEYLHIPVGYILYFAVFCLALGAVACLWRSVAPKG